MRVFTIIGEAGDNVSIASRIQAEGHRCLVYINRQKSRNVGEGLVEKHPVGGVLVDGYGKVDKWVLDKLLVPRPDCIIIDGFGFGKVADILIKKGCPVIGGSIWSDKMNSDSSYSNTVTRMMGITLFNGEPIEGIEVNTELWFNGTDVTGVTHSIIDKEFMTRGIGPNVGCMGNVVWTGFTGSKLFKHGVGKFLPALKKVNYRGPVSFCTLVNSDKLYGLEFTACFGTDNLYVLLEMVKSRVNDLLYSTATGVSKEVKYKSNWGMGVKISILPYPLHCECYTTSDHSIEGVNKFNEKHIWFYDVCKKSEELLASGNGGEIGTVTARGDTVGEWSPVRDAKRRIMRTISNLEIPDLMYRIDIGDRIQREHSQLIKWGWL